LLRPPAAACTDKGRDDEQADGEQFRRTERDQHGEACQSQRDDHAAQSATEEAERCEQSECHPNTQRRGSYRVCGDGE